MATRRIDDQHHEITVRPLSDPIAPTEFAERLTELRSSHNRKVNLIERLDAAGLP